MSLFGPTIIGGAGQSGGSGGSGSSGLGGVALRVSADGSTIEFQDASGSWHPTGLTSAALLASLPSVQLTDSSGTVRATLPGTSS